MPRPHRINWFEIPVTNLDRSAALYSAMLGVEMKREVLFGIPHAIISAEGEGVTGTLITDPKRVLHKGAAADGAGTVVYLDAKDGVAASLARAVEAGAKVIHPTIEIPPF